MLGQRMWDNGHLQQWAHKLGIGRRPGIDLPGEAGPAADASSGATSSSPKAN